MEQINPNDLKTHDRQVLRPPRPQSGGQNKLQDQEENSNPLSKTTTIRKPSSNKRDSSSQKKVIKIQTYMKTKKDSISTDATQKSSKTLNQTSSSISNAKIRGNSQGVKLKTINSASKKLNNEKPKPKISKKKQQQKELAEKKRQMDLDELKRLEEEEEREQALLRFRIEQQKKLSLEEKTRLEGEYNDEANFLLQFESKIYYKEQRKKEYENWNNYLDCYQKPDPDQENTLTQFLYQYGEKVEIKDFNLDQFFFMADYSEEVINILRVAYNNAKADNKHEKMMYYQQFINKIRDITNRKIGEITAYIMKNQQKLIEKLNPILEENNMIQLNGDNLKQIAQKVQQKQELRPLYEFSKYYNSENYKYSIWINPLLKCGYRVKPITFPEIGAGIECPRNYTDQVVMRCVYYRYDYLSRDKMQFYETLGGVYDFQCFKQIPLPMIRSRFMMQRDYNTVEEACYKLEFPQPNFQGSIQELMGFIPLPRDSIYDSENLKIGFFDEVLGRWMLDETQVWITQIDTDKNNVHFKAKIMKPFTFLKSKHTDFPYKSWFLRQYAPGEALLDMVTKRYTFKFEFLGDEIVLRRSNNLEILEELFDVQMQSSELLQKMKILGINLMPEDTDFMGDFENYQVQPDVENKAIQEIIFCLPSFMIKCSPLMQQKQQQQQKNGIQKEQFFQIRENMDFQSKDYESDELEWKTVNVQYKKCGFLNSKNPDKPYKNTQTHASVELILQNHKIVTEDVTERMQNMLYPELQNNVRKFLKLTRIASFS